METNQSTKNYITTREVFEKVKQAHLEIIKTRKGWRQSLRDNLPEWESERDRILSLKPEFNGRRDTIEKCNLGHAHYVPTPEYLAYQSQMSDWQRLYLELDRAYPGRLPASASKDRARYVGAIYAILRGRKLSQIERSTKRLQDRLDHPTSVAILTRYASEFDSGLGTILKGMITRGELK